jgi:fermentation-respiration switch protein FrsA (DUF1100 family)
MKGRIMFWVWSALVGYLLIMAMMFVLQRALLYPASKDVPRLQAAGIDGIEVVTTEPEPGLTLTHWFKRPARPSDPVIVVFHGNAGHIGDRVPKLQALFRDGLGIFLVGYRSYGGNPGKASEEGLSLDARSVLDWLAGEGFAGAQIVLYGESLGTAVAVKAATQYPVAAVVLEAPPSSIAEVAQSHYWYLPAKWLLLDKWDSISRITRIGAPLLVFHGEQDRTVPARFGKKLFAAAAEPKESFYLPSGNHNNLFDFPEVAERVIRFVRAHVPG